MKASEYSDQLSKLKRGLINDIADAIKEGLQPDNQLFLKVENIEDFLERVEGGKLIFSNNKEALIESLEIDDLIVLLQELEFSRN